MKQVFGQNTMLFKLLLNDYLFIVNYELCMAHIHVELT